MTLTAQSATDRNALRALARAFVAGGTVSIEYDDGRRTDFHAGPDHAPLPIADGFPEPEPALAQAWRPDPQPAPGGYQAGYDRYMMRSQGPVWTTTDPIGPAADANPSHHGKGTQVPGGAGYAPGSVPLPWPTPRPRNAY